MTNSNDSAPSSAFKPSNATALYIPALGKDNS